LFFSQTELEDIIQQLDKINASDAGSDAKAFQDAIVKMGQAMLGQFKEDEIRDMDSAVKLTLNLQPGIYLIRSDTKGAKIVVMK